MYVGHKVIHSNVSEKKNKKTKKATEIWGPIKQVPDSRFGYYSSFTFWYQPVLKKKSWRHHNSVIFFNHVIPPWEQNYTENHESWVGYVSSKNPTPSLYPKRYQRKLSTAYCRHNPTKLLILQQCWRILQRKC